MVTSVMNTRELFRHVSRQSIGTFLIFNTTSPSVYIKTAPNTWKVHADEPIIPTRNITVTKWIEHSTLEWTFS